MKRIYFIHSVLTESFIIKASIEERKFTMTLLPVI